MDSARSPGATPIPSRRYFDPAETFAYITTMLRQSPPSRLNMARWKAETRDATRRLADAIIATGVVTEDQLEQGLQDDRAAFQLMRAIDRAFAAVTPYAHSRTRGRLGHYREILEKENRYNVKDSYGAVIPKRSFPGRPAMVPDHEIDHLENLMLVSGQPSPSTRLHFKRIEATFDFPPGPARQRVVVSCIPFLGDLSELDIRRIEDAGAWYVIQPRMDADDWSDHWRQRVRAALKALDDSGADIGILPELALTNNILEWWKEALLQVKRPRGSSLEWILVGTGPVISDPRGEQQPNRAVLLHRCTGEEILCQDKCEPFTFDTDQLEDWGLAAPLSPGPVSEWMQEGRDRYVLDSLIGRFAVLVCEDQGRLFTAGKDVAMLAPTHLLVPIFAPPIIRYRWQEDAAKHFATEIGSASLVATSCAVKLSPSAAKSVKKKDCGTALVVAPKVSNRPSETWSNVEVAVKDAKGDPVRPLVFKLPCC
jgi:predicted amidohydrolase